MIKLISKIILFFAIIITISCVKNNGAQDMIFDFYKQYLSSSINETQRQELIKKYCTKNMLETLDVLYSFDEIEFTSTFNPHWVKISLAKSAQEI